MHFWVLETPILHRIWNIYFKKMLCLLNDIHGVHITQQSRLEHTKKSFDLLTLVESRKSISTVHTYKTHDVTHRQNT